MAKTIENTKAYQSLKAPIYKKVKVTVEIGLDLVPGFGYQVEDHIQVMFNNPYVISATIEEKE